MEKVFPVAYEDYIAGEKEVFIEIVREDGNVSRDPIEKWIDVNFEIGLQERQLLDKVTNLKTLDVGCGSGVHLRYLQRKGIKAFGCDVSEWAVKKARELKVQNVMNISFWNLSEEEKYDQVICMNGTIGFIGKLKNIDYFFDKLSKITTEDAKVFVQGIDWRIDPVGKHEAYIKSKIRENEYPGEIELFLKYKNIEEDKFEWLWIDTDILIAVAKRHGFTLEELSRDKAKYIAIFGKERENGIAHLDEAEIELSEGDAFHIGNLKERSCGWIYNEETRVFNMGPYCLSVDNRERQTQRIDRKELLKKLEPITRVFELPIYIGGSQSPLSKKKPLVNSDIDVYIITTEKTKKEIVSYEEKLQKILAQNMDEYQNYSFSFVEEEWLSLPYFYEAVNLNDDTFWKLQEGEVKSEITRRLKNSRDYLNSISPQNIIDKFNRIFGWNIDYSKVEKITLSPRWKAIIDCNNKM